MEQLTTQETEALAAVAGLGIVTILLVCLVLYVLLVIASWRIFTKAGEPGWKSLIPIYNVYILYKICNLSFLYWFIIPVVASSILSGIGSNIENDAIKIIFALAATVVEIVASVKYCVALAKSFGKGKGFAAGLFFLTNIFLLILGFGSAKYVGNKN